MHTIRNRYFLLFCTGVLLVVLLGWRVSGSIPAFRRHIIGSESPQDGGDIKEQGKLETQNGQKLQGWFEGEDGWFYYSGGSAVRGYKEINGRLYHFDEDGRMTKGFIEEGGFYYFFQENKNGKAAALCDTVKSIGGKSYYFSEKARGFLSTTNLSTDRALAKLMDVVDLQDVATSREKLEICYRLLLEKCSYLGVGTPDFKENWEYQVAENMFNTRRGNCYSYASACYMLARALGIEAELVLGSCMKGDQEDSQHCWVLAEGKYVIDGVYDDNDDSSGQPDGVFCFFWKDYDTLQSDMQCSYKASSTI